MKKYSKFFKFVSVTMVFAIILAACGGGSSTGKKVLRMAESSAPNTINYLKSETVRNSTIFSNFSEGLLTYDKDRKLIGGLAEKWEHKDNVYKFKLRDNLKWSNDTPITANDFVFGWRTLLTLPEAPYKFIMTSVLNADDVAAGKKPATELGIKAIDDRNLEVTFDQDRAYLLNMLTHSTFFPLNEAFYTEVGADNYGTSPETVIASGAFKLSEYNQDTGYTLVKNPNYWDAANVPLDEVNMRIVTQSATQDALYQNDELDVMLIEPNIYDKYKDDPTLKDFPTASMFHIYLSGNTGTPSPALANADFRQAVNYAVDKELLTNNVLKNGSIPMDYLIPRDFADVNGKSYRDFTGIGTGKLRFDVNKAKEYLAKAKENLSDNDLNITFAFSDAEINKLALENIKSQLETNLPGVTVTLNAIPSPTYFQGLAKGDTPAGFSGFAPDYPDVATYFQTFITGNSMNYGKYSNPEYDALYEKAQKELDPVKRATIFKEAEELLAKDGASLPLFQRGRRYVMKDKVEGFHVNSSSPEFDFRFINIK